MRGKVVNIYSCTRPESGDVTAEFTHSGWFILQQSVRGRRGFRALSTVQDKQGRHLLWYSATRAVYCMRAPGQSYLREEPYSKRNIEWMIGALHTTGSGHVVHKDEIVIT